MNQLLLNGSWLFGEEGIHLWGKVRTGPGGFSLWKMNLHGQAKIFLHLGLTLLWKNAPEAPGIVYCLPFISHFRKRLLQTPPVS